MFGVKVNSSKVFYDKEDPLKITVQGGKVIEYTKRMFKKEKEENKNTGDKRRVVYPGVDILTENYMEMYSELQKNYKTSNGQPISFEEIISEVTGMETGYLIKISALKDRPITSANPRRGPAQRARPGPGRRRLRRLRVHTPRRHRQVPPAGGAQRRQIGRASCRERV